MAPKQARLDLQQDQDQTEAGLWSLVVGLGPWSRSLVLVLGPGRWSWSLVPVVGLGPWSSSLRWSLCLVPVVDLGPLVLLVGLVLGPRRRSSSLVFRQYQWGQRKRAQ